MTIMINLWVVDQKLAAINPNANEIINNGNANR